MPSLDGFKQMSASALDRAKLVTGLKQQEEVEETEPALMDEMSELCPKLTYQQRLIGFASCFTLGYLITFMSFRFFIELLEGYPLPFAVNYTVGNILSLLSCMFLCGPQRQFKNMMDEHRKVTSIVYLSCLVATIVVIFLPLPDVVKPLVLLLLIITQLCASVWYSLSYIPYGRRTFLRCANRCLGLDESSSV